VARYPGEEARFLAGVENGIAAAERAEFIEEEEMDARIEAAPARRVRKVYYGRELGGYPIQE